MDRTATETPMLSWMASLADPIRARMLRLVEQQELAVTELCAVLQLPQSTVSRHLKVLAHEGWVAARSEGTSRLYHMAAAQLDPPARRLWALLREESAGTAIAEHDAHRLASVVAQRQTRSQAFFSSAAGQWDQLRHEMFGARFDLMALAGLLEDDWLVADLGCGTGQVAAILAPFVRRVIAVESAAAMLKAARKRLNGCDNVELRRGELEALPIDDGALDAAVICLVLHHVAEPAAVLREAARALRPGGRVLVVDMFRHDRLEYQRQMGHVWLGFDRSQMIGWMDAAGFERLRVQALAADPQAKGPALFAASGRRAANGQVPRHQKHSVQGMHKPKGRAA